MDLMIWALLISVAIDLIMLIFFRRLQIWFKFKIFELTLKTQDGIDDIKRLMNERKSNRKIDSESSEELELRPKSDAQK